MRHVNNNSHCYAVALKYDAVYNAAMPSKDIKKDIADRHRKALQYWIKELGLTVDGWCKKAGIAEGGLRNFLNGASNTMLASNVELLANAVGMSIGELLEYESHLGTSKGKLYSVDTQLMEKSFSAVKMAAADLGKDLSVSEQMDKTVELYNHIMEHRAKGREATPDVAIAALLLKNG